MRGYVREHVCESMCKRVCYRTTSPISLRASMAMVASILRRVTSTTLMSVFRSTKFKSIKGEKGVGKEEEEEEEEERDLVDDTCSASPLLLLLL